MNAPREDATTKLAPGSSAFFLDLDGTLADIAGPPGVVRVDPRMLELLDRLRLMAGGALGIITGRSISSVDGLLAPLRLPVAGQHGIERRSACGRLHRADFRVDALASLLAAARAYAVRHPGLLVEEKGLSLALHFRSAPGLGQELEGFVRRLVEQTAGEFAVQTGKSVFELIPAGRDKGSALREFMEEPPFAGRLPVFLGDDLTDEFGFAVANELGGHSVKIGAGDSCARGRLADVAAVKDWLERVVGGG